MERLSRDGLSCVCASWRFFDSAVIGDRGSRNERQIRAELRGAWHRTGRSQPPAAGRRILVPHGGGGMGSRGFLSTAETEATRVTVTAITPGLFLLRRWLHGRRRRRRCLRQQRLIPERGRKKQRPSRLLALPSGSSSSFRFTTTPHLGS